MAYFNSTSKLSFNCLKAINDSESITEGPAKAYIIKLQYYNLFYFNNEYYFSTKNSRLKAKMKSDKIIVCEFNAGLYEKAFLTATKNITFVSYPSISTVHMFLNYSLNAHIFNFNLLENFLSTLLLIHPPTKQMFTYYYSVLCDCIISINGKDVEKQNLFLYILNSLLSSLQELGKSYPISNKHENVKNYFDVTNQGYEASASNILKIKKKEFVYFDNLTINMKICRSLKVLNLIYQILECDFVFWVSSKGLKFYLSDGGTRPLISYIFWPEVQDIGLINHNVLKLLELFVIALRPQFLHFGIKKTISDFISLIVEIIKFRDKTEVTKCHFFGKKLNDFAHEFSIKLYEGSEIQFALPKDSNYSMIYSAIISFKPYWFNLLLISHLLSLITNFQCFPELAGASDILEHIAYSQYKIKKKKSKQKQSKKPAVHVNPTIVKNFKSYTNINTKYYRGKTLLHIACEEDNVEEVKALLSFSELEINELDDDGWTALHLAAANGSTNCLKELLKKRKRLVPDTRAQGPGGKTPLMCAVSQGYTEICRLLLEHTGSILLEDFNESIQTTVNMTQNKEIKKILIHYKNNFVKTEFGFKNLKYNEIQKGTIIVMCFDLIQQYFLTYKTKEIFFYLKNLEFKLNKNYDALDTRYGSDYKKYEKDITINIPKLCKIVSSLKLMPDYKTFSWFESTLNFLQN